MNTQQTELDLLESQIRECFGRVAYSHKTHEKCSDLALGKLRLIKLVQITLSAATTTAILVTLFGKQQWVLGLGGLISAILMALNIYTKDYNLGEIAEKHREAAVKLWDIRESYVSLIVDIRSQVISPSEIREKRDGLQQRLGKLYSSMPATDSKGYKAAQNALQLREDLTFNHGEIDNFLPSELRKP